MTKRGSKSSSRNAFTAVGLTFAVLVGTAWLWRDQPGDSSSPSPPPGNTGVVESAGPPQPGGKLVYGLISDAHSLNPSTGLWDSEGLEIARNIFDTLAAYDSDGNIQPFLAQAFEHNADYTQWTIVLRPDVKLQNGKPVTAEVVRRNQQHFKDGPITGGPYQLVDSIRADGDLRVVVKLVSPWVTYPYMLATQVGVVGEPDWVDSTNGDHPVGTGPFKVDEWQPDHMLRASKNPLYWRSDHFGNRLPYLDNIEFRPVTEDLSRLTSLLTDTVQIIHAADPHTILFFADEAKRGEFQAFTKVSGETQEVFVQTNGAVEPFNDVDARQALAYATDKQALIDKYESGLFEPADGPYPPSSKWYAPDVKSWYPQYDPVKARELVAKVKAKHDGKFLFTLQYPAGPGIPIVQALQQMWGDVGIDVTLEGTEQNKMIIEAITGRSEAVFWAQFDSPNPVGDSVWWHSRTVKPPGEFSLNFAHNADPRIDAELDDARHSADPKQQIAHYQEVQRRLGQDAPYIWLYHSQISVIASAKVVNVVSYTLPPDANGVERKGLPIQQGFHPLAQVWVKH